MTTVYLEFSSVVNLDNYEELWDLFGIKYKELESPDYKWEPTSDIGIEETCHLKRVCRINYEIIVARYTGIRIEERLEGIEMENADRITEVITFLSMRDGAEISLDLMCEELKDHRYKLIKRFKHKIIKTHRPWRK